MKKQTKDFVYGKKYAEQKYANLIKHAQDKTQDLQRQQNLIKTEHSLLIIKIQELQYEITDHQMNIQKIRSDLQPIIKQKSWGRY